MGALVGLIAMRGSDRSKLTRLPQAAQSMASGLRLARLQAIETGQDVIYKRPASADTAAAITIDGNKQALFAPSGAATAARFVVHDGDKSITISVDALTGRVEVKNGTP